MRRPIAIGPLLLAACSLAVCIAPGALSAAGEVPMCDGLEATYVGPPGGTTYVGTVRDDVIVMGGGRDLVNAGEGDDVICGGRGRDDLQGSLGDDRIFGGRDSRNGRGDVVRGFAGADYLDGGDGPGRDAVSFRSSNSGVTVDLADGTAVGDGTGGPDQLVGIEIVLGSFYADKILGGPADDTLRGGRDDDRIRGRGGDDTLDGQLGFDSGNGDGGTDICVSVELPISCEL